ncbi:hypothetical protein JCM10213_005596 [Rhodosporidiobolus nylandii]
MSTTPLGSYSSSSALSSTHYKLVQAVLEAPDAVQLNAVLLECLRGIRTRWNRRVPSPAKAAHDFVLILYCRAQRVSCPHGERTDEAREMWAAEWALPTAVMLAGGGGGGMKERRMGYRACEDLFPAGPHPLKLLLINTVRSDLHASSYDNAAPAKHALALRAIASPTLATSELVPAVREQVLEILRSLEYPESTRSLALQALLGLARLSTPPASSAEPTSSLLLDARRAVLTLLLPPPPFSSSSSSSSRRRAASRQTLSVNILAALASAAAPSSPLWPILPGKVDRARVQLAILREVLDAAPVSASPGGGKLIKEPSGKYALERCLKGLREELTRSQREGVEQEEAWARVEQQTEELVWEIAAKMLAQPDSLSDALLLSALQLLPLLSSSGSFTFTPSSSATLAALLSHLHTSLLHPTSPTSHLVALRALALLPPSLWTSSPDDAVNEEGNGKQRASPEVAGSAEWGEQAFAAILSGLDSADATVRKATLALLHRVDANLVQMHKERLVDSLNSPARVEGSAASLSSSGKRARIGARHRMKVLERVMETLPYLPSSSSASSARSSLPPPQALVALLDHPSLAAFVPSTEPLAEVILPVLDAFTYTDSSADRTDFARGLLFAEDEKGRGWSRSVTMGTVVAGTVHALAEEQEAETVLTELADFVAGAEVADPDVQALLAEPLTFALLRLLSLCPPSPSLLASVHAILSRAAPSDLLNIALSATSPISDDRGAQVKEKKLQQVGQGTRRKSLAEFGEALLAALSTAPATAYPSAPSARPRSARLESGPHPSSSTSLRYSYPPSTASLVSPSSTHYPLPPTSSAPFSPPSAPASAAALARERRDLLREREDRGGRGGAGESLMGAGALAMLGQGMAVREEDEGSEGEEAEIGGANALGLQWAMGDESMDSAARSREDTGGTGGESGEPPAELLVHLQLSPPPLSPASHTAPLDNLDPFHSG